MQSRSPRIPGTQETTGYTSLRTERASPRTYTRSLKSARSGVDDQVNDSQQYKILGRQNFKKYMTLLENNREIGRVDLAINPRVYLECASRSNTLFTANRNDQRRVDMIIDIFRDRLVEGDPLPSLEYILDNLQTSGLKPESLDKLRCIERFVDHCQRQFILTMLRRISVDQKQIGDLLSKSSDVYLENLKQAETKKVQTEEHKVLRDLLLPPQELDLSQGSRHMTQSLLRTQKQQAMRTIFSNYIKQLQKGRTVSDISPDFSMATDYYTTCMKNLNPRGEMTPRDRLRASIILSKFQKHFVNGLLMPDASSIINELEARDLYNETKKMYIDYFILFCQYIFILLQKRRRGIPSQRLQQKIKQLCQKCQIY